MAASRIGDVPYLIDGHNLIPKTGLRLDAVDDEMELVQALQAFLREARREAEVYFDGAPPGRARTKRFGRVTAHFVPAGATADAAIESRLTGLGGAARNWIVVSSDREVRNAARACHARTVSSEEFAAELRAVGTPEAGQISGSGSGRHRALSSPEIEEWLRIFGKRK